MALLTALVCVMGSACVEARDPSVKEATGEAELADVILYPPGATFSCTMPGSGPAGLAWATLKVGEDRHTCYQYLDTNRTDPASPSAVSCQVFGDSIGCTKIIKRKPEPRGSDASARRSCTTPGSAAGC
jgi:hypothetical protein